MVAPLVSHPTNKNGVIVYDLRFDPEPFFDLSTEELGKRLFTPSDELPDGVVRLPLKTVHLNKSPVVVPMTTLTERAAIEWEIDVARSELHLKKLAQAGDWLNKISKIHKQREFEPVTDPDRNLYGGGFFSDDDRRRMAQVRSTPPSGLAELHLAFDDARLPEMLFRYRARNWPETLSREETGRWDEFRLDRITRRDGGGSITLDEYRARLARLIIDPSLGADQRAILSQLADWPDFLS
jgi:exodeoxyribonuclease-1